MVNVIAILLIDSNETRCFGALPYISFAISCYVESVPTFV